MHRSSAVALAVAAGVAAGAACWATSPARPAARAAGARPPLTAFTIGEHRFGPIAADTPATLAHMRELFAGYDVRPVNDPGLEYHVYAGREQLLFVVTTDDLSVFNVHATSSRVAVQGYSWRVGTPFHDTELLTSCECWGEHPTCYRAGDHVAVNFAVPCDPVTAFETAPAGTLDQATAHATFAVLDGAVPERIIWSPSAFGVGSAAPGDGVDGPDGADGSVP